MWKNRNKSNMVTREEFETELFYSSYEAWLTSYLAEDFYYPIRFDDDGNIISDDYMDEKGLEQAKRKVFEAAQRACDDYLLIPQKMYGLDVFHISDSKESEIFDGIAVWCTAYIMAKIEIDKRPSSFNHIRLRNVEEFITTIAIRNHTLNDWLSFMSLCLHFQLKSKLPDVLSTPEAMIWWNKLKKAGFVNDEYQIVWKDKMTNYQVYLISLLFANKICCHENVFHKHFKTRKGKQYQNLRRERDNTKQPYAPLSIKIERLLK